MSKTKKTIIVLLILVVLIAAVPLFALKGAEFGGSDDSGSVVVSEVTGTEYVPWKINGIHVIIKIALTDSGQDDKLNSII
jgi:ABC-type cobalt transport system, periplasmic component